MKYFSKIGVAEFVIESNELNIGDKILITGTTTGVIEEVVDEIRFDLEPVNCAVKGQHISFRVPGKVRPNDKLYKLVSTNELALIQQNYLQAKKNQKDENSDIG